MPKIIVKGPTYGSHQPMRLNVNGQSVEFPVNTEVTVTDEQLLALGDTDHEITILEGSTAADEAADEAPAPADSGGGGEGDGGGQSGDGPAVDTPPAPPPPPPPPPPPVVEDVVEEVALPENFLDRSVAAIVPDLAGLNKAQLEHARKAEDGGKTRKSLLAAIDGVLNPPPAA